MDTEKTKAHLDSLIFKHRSLDSLIEKLYIDTYNTDEIRKLKTQKLWLKDEIYRLQKKLGVTNE